MKNLKLLFCLFALLGFVACGDDDDPTFALKDYISPKTKSKKWIERKVLNNKGIDRMGLYPTSKRKVKMVVE